MTDGTTWINGNAQRIMQAIIGVLLVIVTALTTLVVQESRGDIKYVLRCEYDALNKRLDRQDTKMTRIEDKIDRLIDRGVDVK